MRSQIEVRAKAAELALKRAMQDRQAESRCPPTGTCSCTSMEHRSIASSPAVLSRHLDLQWRRALPDRSKRSVALLVCDVCAEHADECNLCLDGEGNEQLTGRF